MDEQNFETEQWEANGPGEVGTDPPPNAEDYFDDDDYRQETGAWENRKRKRMAGEPVSEDYDDPDEYHAALSQYHIREGIREGLERGREPSEGELNLRRLELMDPHEFEQEQRRYDLSAQAEEFRRRSEQAQEMGDTYSAREYKKRTEYIQRDIDEMPRHSRFEKNCVEAGSLSIQERLHLARGLTDTDFERARPEYERDMYVVNQGGTDPRNEPDCSIWVVPKTSPYFPFPLNDKKCRPIRVVLPEGMTGRLVTEQAKASRIDLFDYLAATGRIDVDDVRSFIAEASGE
jgi:hypothetical protein